MTLIRTFRRGIHPGAVCYIPRTFQAWMPSINKNCHQNVFLSIVQIMLGWLLLYLASSFSIAIWCYELRKSSGKGVGTQTFLSQACASAAISEWFLGLKGTAFSNFKLWKIFWLGKVDPFSHLCWFKYRYHIKVNNWVFQTLFLSLYTATPPHEDYMQVDYVLLPRYKSVRKKNRKDFRVKRTVQELKTG